MLSSTFIDDFGTRKLQHTAAQDLLEIIMRRYEHFITVLTSNRPVQDWANYSVMSPQAAPCSTAGGILSHAPGIYRVGARMEIS